MNITNVPLWLGMLKMGEAVHVLGGRGNMGKPLMNEQMCMKRQIPFSQFCGQAKTVLKNFERICILHIGLLDNLFSNKYVLSKHSVQASGWHWVVHDPAVPSGDLGLQQSLPSSQRERGAG